MIKIHRTIILPDCDRDHYLVSAKVREKLAVGKQAAQRFDRQRINFRNFNEPEVREQYQIEITNRFAALENLSDDEGVNRTWENIKKNIQTSAKESLGLHELKQNKSWFDEEYLGFFWIKGSRLKCSGYRIQAKAKYKVVQI